MIVTGKSIVGWIDLSKEVVEGLLVDVILRVNQEDKVLLTEQESRKNIPGREKDVSKGPMASESMMSRKD